MSDETTEQSIKLLFQEYDRVRSDLSLNWKSIYFGERGRVRVVPEKQYGRVRNSDRIVLEFTRKSLQSRIYAEGLTWELDWMTSFVSVVFRKLESTDPRLLFAADCRVPTWKR